MLSLIFTKTEYSTSQRRMDITYKIDTDAHNNLNLMPFKIFKVKKRYCMLQRTNQWFLKTCSNSNIEQSGVFAVKLCHNSKTDR